MKAKGLIIDCGMPRNKIPFEYVVFGVYMYEYMFICRVFY